MKDDFPAACGRLLADFSQMVEVLATTTPSTVLVAYCREDEVDGWLEVVGGSVAARRLVLRDSHVRDPAKTSTVV
ncbi:MAG: hypothetical protein WCD11_21070 [Solirubrobacteraceae bacterium]